jgi:proprotein convertase subtilisin/kexin type 5
VLGCPNNCLSCSNSSVCTLCINGYSPNAMGVCLPCLSNCRGCSSQANGVCLNCGQGFYLNTQQTCVACSTYCLSCSAIGCSQCMAGYTLTSNYTCSLNCKIPCATCNAANTSICTSCLAGYFFSLSSS